MLCDGCLLEAEFRTCDGKQKVETNLKILYVPLFYNILHEFC